MTRSRCCRLFVLNAPLGVDEDRVLGQIWRVAQAIWPLVFVVLYSSSALSGEWKYTSSASANMTWTDNVNSSSDPELIQEDFLSRLSTNWSLDGGSRRLKGSVQGNAQHVSHLTTDSDDTLSLRYDANVDASLLPGRWNMSVRATRSQQIIDRREAIPELAVAEGSDNITTTTTLSADTSYQRKFSNLLQMNVSANASQVDNSGAASGSGGTSYRVSTELSQGAAFRSFGWGVNYNYSEEANGAVFSDVGVSVNYRVGPKLILNFDTGFDLNDFESSQEETGGLKYNAGAQWTISRRTNLGLSIGEQLSSTTYGLNFSHTLRNGGVNANYSETLSTSSRLEEGRLIFDDSGTVLLGIELPTLTDDVFVQKSGSLNGNLSRGRSSYNASLTWSRSEFQQGDTQEETLGGQIGWSLNLDTRTSTNLSASYNVFDFIQENRQDDLFSMTWSLNYQLMRDVSTSMTATRTERSSNQAGLDSTVNTIALGINAQF